MKTIEIVERIEGEAKLECTWNENKIEDVKIKFFNFRGFEYILENKPILDALVYTPRVCGICNQAHLKATTLAIENLYKELNEPLYVSSKAKILREIGLNIEIIDSHIKWFYMFIMPDIAKINGTSIFDGYEAIKGKKWKEGIKASSEIIKALAIIGGQWPHTSYMLPGGVMSDPTQFDMILVENYLDFAISFLENNLIGYDFENYLSFNSIEDLNKISKDLKDFKDICFEQGFEKIGKSYDRHIVLSDSLSFSSGKIKIKNIHKIDIEKVKEFDLNTFKVNEVKKENEYSWSKSALYADNFYETGPLSRALIQNRKFIRALHKEYKDSVFTRVMARVDEITYLLYKTKELISKINISDESYIKPKFKLKDFHNVSAKACVEAARGSLLHKIEVNKGLIKKYDIITPTVWNLGPEYKADKGVAQKAIIGSTSMQKAKIILRSFDVCSVCTSH